MGGVRGEGGVQVIDSKGCSRLFKDMSSSSLSFSSFRARIGGAVIQSSDAMSPTPSSSSVISRSSGPFFGLVICVTGLSKEARKQVMDATQRLGGQYSPHLHPQCSHLVVQSFHGRKFAHALKHGSRNGLFVVTIGWFVDSVRRNARLSESLYSVQSADENGAHLGDLQHVQYFALENSCLPVSILEHANQSEMTKGPRLHSSEEELNRTLGSTLAGHSLYIDSHISAGLRSKVIEAASLEGARILDQWFVGCSASLVVCEGPSVRKYLGHSNNLITPMWFLKTAKENRLRRLVHISADLARQVGTILDDAQHGINGKESNGSLDHPDALISRSRESHEERQKTVDLAKVGVRKRRTQRMQTCQTPVCPITPSSLLDSICWSISEPTSTAAIYTDSFSAEDASERHSIFFYSKGNEKDLEPSFENFSRLLTESEKTELIFKSQFLTILFPVDRFSEMGPCSRTFFSSTGFTCLQMLDYIYLFYQENMSAQEIDVAIHTDSRHADRLRSVYSSKETVERGFVEFKRIDFLGSRKSFEMLKRVAGDNSSNVYELLIRA